MKKSGKEPPYLVALDQERFIQFENGEDALVYFGMTGNYTRLYDHFLVLKKQRLTTREYRYYQAQGQRFRHILETAQLTDGTPLLEVVRGRMSL